MKPIKLKMSAFGPYKNEIDIDFNILGDNGIFLITGDTGAGKTTIFDAICFALFGEVSGSNRTIDSLRSDFATSEVKTFVELEFSHKNKNYKIVRYPKYLKQKKNGMGTTSSIADASLIFYDKVITGFKEVTEVVIEILGINVKQFKQIAMLAQGEFLKLLFADTNERSEIFRKIFETNIFHNISDKLRIRANQAKSILDDKKLELDIHIKNIQWEIEPIESLEVFELLEILNNLIENDKSKEIEYKKEKNECQKILDNVKKELDTSEYINKSIDELELNKMKFEKMLEFKQKNEEDILIIKNNRIALEKINPIENDMKKMKTEILNEEKNIKNINKEIINNNKKLNILKIEHDNLEQQENKLKIYYSDISKLSEKLSLYDETEQLNKEIIEMEYNLEKTTTEYSNIIDTNKNLEIVIENKIKLSNQSINYQTNIQLLTKEQDDISRQIDMYNQLIKDIRDVKELEIDYDNKRKQFLIKQKKYDIIQNSYNELEMKFLAGQAGMFASKLVVGSPCLVCGSIDHPSPAKIIGDVITKQELDLTKKNKEKLYNELLDYASVLKTTDTIIIFKKEKISKDINLNYEINIIESKVYELLDILREKFDYIVKDILVKTNFLKSLENVENEIKENRESLEKNKEKAEQHEKLITDISSKLNSKKGEVSNLIKNLPKDYSTKIDLELYISIITKKSNTLQQNINDIKIKYNKTSVDLEKNQVLLKKIEEIVSNNQIQYIQLEIKFKNAYMEMGFTSEEDYFNTLISRDDLILLEKKVNNYQMEYKIVEEKIDRLLIDTNGKVKIDTANLINKKVEIEFNLDRLELIFKELNLRLQINIDNYKKIKLLYEKIKDMIDDYLLYKDLSDTANGTISGKQKIVFEQFVQASYFNIVIEASNKRLMPMTSNRYLLTRREISDKISDKLALELEIMDNYTGKTRNIKSLSGGESFKAALSLALGLSDTIQNFAGGVVVDNMFIDEGFGSLDSESLEQALNTLNGLTEGNRLIGIISHVAELKERIDKKIIIYKTNDGSNVKIVI